MYSSRNISITPIDQISKTMKPIFIHILINSKRNNCNIYSVQYKTKLHPFEICLEFFQTKIQNFSIAITKIISLLKLSRFWKMAFSISIKPVHTLLEYLGMLAWERYRKVERAPRTNDLQ